MSSHNPLTQLRLLDTSSPTFYDQASSILCGKEYMQWMPDLQGEDLMGLVDYLDNALNTLNPDSPAFRKCLRELRNICGPKTILPTSYTVSSQLLDVSPDPVAQGNFVDVHKGTLNNLKVCVKRVRIYSEQDSHTDLVKAFYQEAVVWKRLKHQNIVPFLGITTKPLQLISEWMPGGVLTDYITRNPNADRRSLVCDVASGLYYIHSCNIIHGGLKGPNILVDATDRARIADFSLTTVTQNPDSIQSATRGHNNTAQWTAPEILTGKGTFSKEADIFSFAMVMIEGFTGAAPFGAKPRVNPISAITGGGRPTRPIHQNFTDDLWKLTIRCWHQDPRSRPEVVEVYTILHGSSPSPILQGFQVDPLSPTSTDTSPDDGGRGAPPLDSQDTGGGTLSESGANSGSATNKAQNLAEAATKVEVGRQEKEVGLLKRIFCCF